jgi:multidrug efflux system outer membrane protein
VTIAAEVARNYLELRGAQARLAVANRNLDTQRETCG